MYIQSTKDSNTFLIGYWISWLLVTWMLSFPLQHVNMLQLWMNCGKILHFRKHTGEGKNCIAFLMLQNIFLIGYASVFKKLFCYVSIMHHILDSSFLYSEGRKQDGKLLCTHQNIRDNHHKKIIAWHAVYESLNIGKIMRWYCVKCRILDFWIKLLVFP